MKKTMKHGEAKKIIKLVIGVLAVFVLLIFGTTLLFGAPAVIKENKFQISFSGLKDQIEQFNIMELDVNFKGVFDNPFDPGEIDIKAHFISPDRNELIVPAFYYRGFTRNLSGSHEKLTPAGIPQWKLRFTPRKTGTYRVFLTAQFGQKKIKTEEKTFKVVKSDKPGFVRAGSGPYLFFDSGETFFGIGENVAWADNRGRTDYARTYEYDAYFEKLSDNGANIVRIWMVSWNLGLEWTERGAKKQGGFAGLGRYNLQNAWRLDHILQEARKRGLYVILVLGNYAELMTAKGFFNEQQWRQNPYNASNNGPCINAADFWTNESARDYYKKRLRYITARWGAYTNLLGFELWNETNAPVFWVKEMSEYIKEADPYNHLVTTSLGMLEFDGFNEDEIWKLPSIDFSQVHIYGSGGSFVDFVDQINYRAKRYITKYGKPFLIGEYGINWMKSDKFYDAQGEGVHIHNSLWAGLFSQSLGGAMNWWWDSYINPKNLYNHYQTLSLFVKNLDLPRNGWRIAKFRVDVKENVQTDEIDYYDLSVPVIDAWGSKDNKEIKVLNDGTFKGGRLNKYLHGMDKKDIRVRPVFKVDYPERGEFIISVGEVSINAALNVYVDGKKVFSREFPKMTSEGVGDWKKKNYREQWGIYQYEYYEDYKIDIPQGKHSILLENVGEDWLSIEKIVLTNYRKGSTVRVLGLQQEKEAIFWIQNKQSNWYNNYKEIKPQEIKGAVLEVLDLADGEYRIEWWDTWKGEPAYREKSVSSDKRMRMKIPSFKRDIALRINRAQK